MTARKHRRVRRATGPVALDPTSLVEPIVVTGLAPHPRRTDRVTVDLNDITFGALPIDLVVELSLKAGSVIERSALDDVLSGCRRTALLDKGLDLLAVRARSSRDLQARLRRTGAAEADIAWVIDRLTAQGFLDDASYARSVARGRMLSGGVSRRRVESELRRVGIASDVTAAAIADTVAEVGFDEHDAACGAARKRLRALGTLDSTTRRRRLHAWLSRRGYQPDLVLRVLLEVIGEAADRD